MSQSKRTTADRIQLGLAGVALLIAVAVLVLWQLEKLSPPWYAWIYCIALLAMSGVTFIAYWIDKRKARKEQWRISERTLHRFELLGGWPGALFARQWLRHKTVKGSYRVVFWLIVVVHIAVIGLAAWMSVRGQN